MNMTTSATRVYLVLNNATGERRLIRATHRAVAIRHAAQHQYKAHRATHDELEQLITSGIRVEQAADAAPEPDTEAQLP